MPTILTPSELRTMEAHRRHARLRSLLAESDRRLAELGLSRAELQAALNQPPVESTAESAPEVRESA